MTFFAIADFVKFFQQFAIDAAVRHFYSFTLDGELLCLTTVPTGGVGPPLLAEALTRAICAAAVRLLGHQDINSVIYDTMIDNVRFVADSAELIVRVWHNFVDICARVGVTMGEVTPPSCTNGQTEYVFLGLSFRQLCGVTAGPKLGDKLAQALLLLSSAGECAILDWLAVFGVCSFVSYALHVPTKRFYFVIKFIRRIARCHYRLEATHARVWLSIVELWKEWISTLLVHSFFPTGTPSTATNIVAYSDASGSGWGGAILIRGRKIIGGDTWSQRAASHDINVKETMAARNTLRKILDDVVVKPPSSTCT
jgi:hypothetical protein